MAQKTKVQVDIKQEEDGSIRLTATRLQGKKSILVSSMKIDDEVMLIEVLRKITTYCAERRDKINQALKDHWGELN